MMKFPVEVKTILEELLNSPKFKKRWADHLIQSKWENWVGMKIAQHIRPGHLKDDQLVVIIDDERWASSFDGFKDKILENMEKDLGFLSIKGFSIMVYKKRPGSKSQKKRPKEKAKRKNTLKVQMSSPAKSLGKEIEMDLNSIKNPEVRDALKRLIVKDLSFKKK